MKFSDDLYFNYFQKFLKENVPDFDWILTDLAKNRKTFNKAFNDIYHSCKYDFLKYFNKIVDFKIMKEDDVVEVCEKNGYNLKTLHDLLVSKNIAPVLVKELYKEINI